MVEKPAIEESKGSEIDSIPNGDSKGTIVLKGTALSATQTPRAQKGKRAQEKGQQALQIESIQFRNGFTADRHRRP